MSSNVLKTRSWGTYGTRIKRTYPAQVAARSIKFQTYSSADKIDPTTTIGCRIGEEIKSGSTVLFKYTAEWIPYSCGKLWPKLRSLPKPWNAARQPTSPYWSGATLLVDAKASRETLHSVIFPVAWYKGCAAELKQLLTVSFSSNEEQLAWCVHVSWCVYNMMLASNVYPLQWRVALDFAKHGKDFTPEERGYWPVDFNDVAFLKPLPTDVEATLVTHPFFNYLTFASGSGGFGGVNYPSLAQTGNVWFEYLLGKLPWMGLNQNFPNTSSTVSADEIADAKARDVGGARGLVTLVQRAAFFGGLDAVNTAFNASDSTALVNYWRKMASFIVDVDYWRLVQGGVSAWFWLVRDGENEKKLAVCNTDMITFYKVWKKQEKFQNRAVLTGFMIKGIKIMVDFLQSNWYAVGKGMHEQRLWMEDRVEELNEGNDPGLSSFTMPPPFIRSLSDPACSFDVMHAAKETVCERSGECEVMEGTAAVLAKFERAVCKAESLLEQPIQTSARLLTTCSWGVTVATGPAKEMPHAPPPKAQQQVKPSMVFPVSVAVGVTSVVGYLLWSARK